MKVRVTLGLLALALLAPGLRVVAVAAPPPARITPVPPVGPSPITPDCRWLFVVDTSSAMQRHADGLYRSTHRLVATGLGGRMRDGDVFTVWTYADTVLTREFPLNAWTPELNIALANRTYEFLAQQKFRGKSNLRPVFAELSQALAIATNLTIVIVSDGTDVIVGTPFDRPINVTYGKRASEMRTAKMPFVTSLVTRRGEFTAWSVRGGLEDVGLPFPEISAPTAPVLVQTAPVITPPIVPPPAPVAPPPPVVVPKPVAPATNAPPAVVVTPAPVPKAPAPAPIVPKPAATTNVATQPVPPKPTPTVPPPPVTIPTPAPSVTKAPTNAVATITPPTPKTTPPPAATNALAPTSIATAIPPAKKAEPPQPPPAPKKVEVAAPVPRPVPKVEAKATPPPRPTVVETPRPAPPVPTPVATKPRPAVLPELPPVIPPALRQPKSVLDASNVLAKVELLRPPATNTPPAKPLEARVVTPPPAPPRATNPPVVAAPKTVAPATNAPVVRPATNAPVAVPVAPKTIPIVVPTTPAPKPPAPKPAEKKAVATATNPPPAVVIAKPPAATTNAVAVRPATPTASPATNAVANTGPATPKTNAPAASTKPAGQLAVAGTGTRRAGWVYLAAAVALLVVAGGIIAHLLRPRPHPSVISQSLDDRRL
jgi:hypothetical protein